MGPKFVAVCGIDGAGKSTLIGLLKEMLEHRSQKVRLLKSPSEWFRNDENVRRMLEHSETSLPHEFYALFSAADKLRIQIDELVPALDNGEIVLMDRYVYSSYAYVNARAGTDIFWLKEINKFSIMPDLVAYLDIEPSIALKRIINRDGKSLKRDEQDLTTLTKVRDNFLCFASDEDFLVLDGQQDAAVNADIVMSAIMRGAES